MDIKPLKDKERELFQQVLDKTGWNLEKAARLLRIPLAQVRKKVREHGMRLPEFPAAANGGNNFKEEKK